MFSGVSAEHMAHVTCPNQAENLKKAEGLKQKCTYGLFLQLMNTLIIFPSWGK